MAKHVLPTLGNPIGDPGIEGDEGDRITLGVTTGGDDTVGATTGNDVLVADALVITGGDDTFDTPADPDDPCPTGGVFEAAAADSDGALDTTNALTADGAVAVAACVFAAATDPNDPFPTEDALDAGCDGGDGTLAAADVTDGEGVFAAAANTGDLLTTEDAAPAAGCDDGGTLVAAGRDDGDACVVADRGRSIDTLPAEDAFAAVPNNPF
ncbi:MAG: hypothetical protein LBB05_01340 [Puniceicoccales bacterium]|nr:hypothetical protein [Puniceicoccales bacterium]